MVSQIIRGRGEGVQGGTVKDVGAIIRIYNWKCVFGREVFSELGFQFSLRTINKILFQRIFLLVNATQLDLVVHPPPN